jgi:hypothetical protein
VSTNQRIGFGKKVRWEWLLLSLRLRAKEVAFDDAREELELLIAQTNPGKAAITKIISNLRQVVFQPVAAHRGFAEHGIELFRHGGEATAIPVIWGLSVASYSFFAQTGETIGRLLKLHEEFTAAEMLRRLAERVGDRGFVSRVARYNLSSMLDWEIIGYEAARKKYYPGHRRKVHNDEIATWLFEAVLLASGKAVVATQQIYGSPLLFPFDLSPVPSARIAKANPRLSLVRQSLSEEHLSLDSDSEDKGVL